jgi:cyclophilin family peptidyl-prolyl cis-trans isomerase
MKRLGFVSLLLLGLGLYCPLRSAFAVAADKKVSKNPVVVIDTSMGKITVELFADKAPITVKNFLSYVDDKFYDGTVFHRVLGKPNADKDFMIQGGGFQRGLVEKETKKPIKNEAGNGLSNERGTLAMARTNDPDSATAQFFINVAANDFLDKNDRSAGYAVFGKVVQGMDVVDKIKAVETHEAKATVRTREGKNIVTEFQNVPVKEVVIKSIRHVPETKKDESSSKDK